MRRFATRLGALALALLGGAVPLVSSAPSATAAEATVIGTVVSGFHHSCVLMSDATVKCWGGNNTLQVGDGATAPNVDQTAPVASTASSVRSVAAGDNHSCVLLTAGTVQCWGSDQFGQLGGSRTPPALPPAPPATSFTGTGTASPTSVKLTSGADLTGIVDVSAGSFFSCALQNTGKVFCWGDNSKGQIGVAPATTDWTYDSVDTSVTPNVTTKYPLRISPTEVTGITNAIAVDAGSYHACALLATGTVTCWGDNTVGQLGNGSRGGTSPTPVAVAGLDKVGGITAGFAHSCARKTGGTVFCWGSNTDGQLGIGTTDNSSTNDSPQPVVNLAGVAAVAAGWNHTCAVTATNEVFCWGDNFYGQLGNGTTADSVAPVKAAGISTAVAIAPGSAHTCAVLSSSSVGSMKCWGSNERGQLGTARATCDATTTASPNCVTITFVVTVPPVPPATTPTTTTTSTYIPISSTPIDVSGVAGVAVVKSTTPPPTPPSGLTPTPTSSVTDIPFSPLSAPVRLLDTRNPGGATIDNNPSYTAIGTRQPTDADFGLQVTGRTGTGIPSTAASVMLNVTVVGAVGDGYLTVYPCGQTRPEASNLNFGAGDTIPNSVIAKVGSAGKVCIYTSAETNVLVDAAGYFADTSVFTPLANPARILETRTLAAPTIDGLFSNIGRRSANATLPLTVTNRAGVPSSSATVVLNVTAIGGDAPGGFLTVYPCGAPQPNASNVNFAANDTIPNLVVAKVGTSGQVCIFNEVGVDLAVDVAGFFGSTSAYTPLSAPARFLDTRSGGATFDGADRPGTPVTGGTTYRLTVGGRGGISPTAGAVLLNVTAVNAVNAGYLTVYPCGATQPNASNLNYDQGQTIANSVAAAIGSGKQVCIFASGTTDILVDVAGTLS